MPDERHAPDASSSYPPALKAEAALLRRIQAGDEQALERLLRIHWNSLLRYSKRILKNPVQAEEAVRDTFIQLWHGRRDWSEEGGLRAALFRSVRSNARRKGQRGAPLPNSANAGTQGPSREDRTEPNGDLVRQAVNALPGLRREVFLLVRIHELSCEEVAYVVGLPPEDVEQEVCRAMREIGAALPPNGSPGGGSDPVQLHGPREARLKRNLSAPD